MTDQDTPSQAQTQDQTEEKTEEKTEDDDVEPESTEAPTDTPEERLEALGAEIHDVRQRVDDAVEQDDRQFIESGDEEPVDDTIAPPG